MLHDIYIYIYIQRCIYMYAYMLRVLETDRMQVLGPADMRHVNILRKVGLATGWRRLIGSPKLQIIFHKRATKYRDLLRKMTYKDKGELISEAILAEPLR